MNRESFLFLLIGLLAGFLAGYVVQEEMAEIQPQRVPAAAAAAAAAGAPPTAGPAMAPGGAGGAPMQQIEALRKRLEANPDDEAALLELANLNFDIQNWARARELYERLLALRPRDPDVLTDLGITLRAQGDFDGALVRFREAQAVAPAHWQARFNEIVVLAIDQNDLAVAETRLTELEKLVPGNSDVTRLAEEVRRRRSGGR